MKRSTIITTFMILMVALPVALSAQTAGEMCKNGEDYYYGRNGKSQNYAKAVEWWAKAAEKGDAKAQYNLGSCYYYGEGVAENEDKAIYWYKKAAAQDYTDSFRQLAWVLFLREETQETVMQCLKFAMKGAVKGDATCQYLCADLYLLMSPARADLWNIDEGMKWLRKSAEQGYAKAQYQFGEFLLDGTYCKQDVPAGISLLRKAAAQEGKWGQEEALFLLAGCYLAGKGVAKDVNMALKIYNDLAANGSNPTECDAKAALGEIYYTGKYVAKDYKKAFEYYSTAASNGDIKAKNRLGEMYYWGQYVKQDYNKAFKYFTETLDGNFGNPLSRWDPVTLRLLSNCYRFGLGTNKDPVKARELLQEAAEYGDEEAEKLLKALK